MNFKRYTGDEKFLDLPDHNRRAELLDRVRHALPADGMVLGGMILTRNRPTGGGGTLLTPVRLTAFDATNKIYTGVKQEADGLGGYSDISPTISLKCFEIKNFIGIELGAIVSVHAVGSWTGSESAMPVGTALYGFKFVNPRQAFEVTVSQSGGSNGTATTQASWTYTVTNADGHALGTGKAPEFKGFRLSVGPVVAGTVGMASYDDAATLRLLTINELHGSGACT